MFGFLYILKVYRRSFYLNFFKIDQTGLMSTLIVLFTHVKFTLILKDLRVCLLTCMYVRECKYMYTYVTTYSMVISLFTILVSKQKNVATNLVTYANVIRGTSHMNFRNSYTV